MNDAGTATGKVVVHRTMSLDGFIAGPGDSMDWIFEYVTPDQQAEIMAATGAMIAGRRTCDVGQRDTGKPSGEAGLDGAGGAERPSWRTHGRAAPGNANRSRPLGIGCELASGPDGHAHLLAHQGQPQACIPIVIALSGY